MKEIDIGILVAFVTLAGLAAIMGPLTWQVLGMAFLLYIPVTILYNYIVDRYSHGPK